MDENKKIEQPLIPEMPEQEVEKPIEPETGEKESQVEAPAQPEQEIKKQMPRSPDKVGEKKQVVKKEKAPESKSDDLIRIEEILSDGLADLFSQLPEHRQAEFKKKGEETAREIEKLLQAKKPKESKIVKLIKKWLSMIPGVNKFFLEQDSKIKADELLKSKREQV